LHRKEAQMSLQRFVLRCLWAGFVLAPLLQAQQSQWQNLTQIRRGTKVEVVEQSLKSTSGRFVRFSDTDLTVKVKNEEVIVARDQVYRVSVNGKNRKRNMLIGLAAGAGAGAAWSAGLRNLDNWRAGDTAGLVGGCAGIGVGIGALIPSTKTVYRAEGSKQASPKEQSQRKP
jgi:hypothetical protein